MIEAAAWPCRLSMPAGHLASACLEQEPGAALRLIDPYFDEAGGGDVAVFVTHVVGLAQSRRERLVVLTQFRQHVLRLDVNCIVVQDPLQPRNVADRPERGSADLADAFGDGV